MDMRPLNCRFRLKDEGKPYPRSSCVACGRNITTGLGNECADHPKDFVDAVLMAKDATLRDWFAGQALAGQNLSGIGWQHKAKQAYEVADAMLAEREEGK